MSKIDNIKKLMDEKGVNFREFEYETRSEDEYYTVEGRPVVFNSETYLFNDGEYDCYEVIDRTAFDNADMSDVIFNYNHSGRVYARTRNDSLSLSVDDDGMNAVIKLWKDDAGHDALYKDISRGNIDKMSFAFTISDSSWEEDKENKRALRHIKGIDRLFDVSAVDIPAYDDTMISARNELLTERQDILTERRNAESKAAELEKRKAELKDEIEKITGGHYEGKTE